MVACPPSWDMQTRWFQCTVHVYIYNRNRGYPFFDAKMSSRIPHQQLKLTVINQHTNGGLPIIIESQWGEWIKCGVTLTHEQILSRWSMSRMTSANSREPENFQLKLLWTLGHISPEPLTNTLPSQQSLGFSQATLSHTFFHIPLRLHVLNSKIYKADQTSVALHIYHFQQYCFTKQAVMLLDK